MYLDELKKKLENLSLNETQKNIILLMLDLAYQRGRLQYIDETIQKLDTIQEYD